MGTLVLIIGILLLIGGIPAIWKFAKGTARLILSLAIFFGIICLLWKFITALSLAV